MTSVRDDPLQPPPGPAVEWDTPEDERLFWMRNKLHFPHPVSELDGSLYAGPFAQAFSSALAALQAPVGRYRIRRINGYLYEAVAPLAGGPEEMAERAGRCEQALRETMERLDRMWEQELWPEAATHLAAWGTFDLGAASLGVLLDHLGDSLARATRCWEIHLRADMAAMIAVSEFDELYRELFAPQNPLDSYRLTQGADSGTMEVARALWALAQRAPRWPAVRHALERLPAERVVQELRDSEDGRAFLAELTAYLTEYGQRAERYEVAYPSWIEDPAPVITSLRDLTLDAGRSPTLRMQAQRAERDRLVAEAQSYLVGYPQPVVDEFSFLLRSAQTGAALHEHSAASIEFPLLYRLRRLFLEFGRRLAIAGTLSNPEDVFCLTAEEIRETAAALPRVDRRDLVGIRRSEMERFRASEPPAFLGTPPSTPPTDDAFGRMLGKFFGAPPIASSEPHLLIGNPGSPGKARGKAKVVRTLREASKLSRGDILVTETTAPPWTPLFATAAAVVTEVGGVLSHCAVVAREFQIPAVVGAHGATKKIRDGDLLEVDGDAGLVLLIAE